MWYGISVLSFIYLANEWVDIIVIWNNYVIIREVNNNNLLVEKVAQLDRKQEVNVIHSLVP